MEEGELSPEMILDNDYENDDSAHHCPGHVDEDNVEVEVVEDNSEKGKNETMIHQRQMS